MRHKPGKPGLFSKKFFLLKKITLQGGKKFLSEQKPQGGGPGERGMSCKGSVAGLGRVTGEQEKGSQCGVILG
jgi:hypothetical protein